MTNEFKLIKDNGIITEADNPYVVVQGNTKLPQDHQKFEDTIR